MRRVAKCAKCETLAIEVNFFVYGRRKYKWWAMARCGRMDAVAALEFDSGGGQKHHTSFF